MEYKSIHTQIQSAPISWLVELIPASSTNKMTASTVVSDPFVFAAVFTTCNVQKQAKTDN